MLLGAPAAARLSPAWRCRYSVNASRREGWCLLPGRLYSSEDFREGVEASVRSASRAFGPGFPLVHFNDSCCGSVAELRSIILKARRLADNRPAPPVSCVYFSLCGFGFGGLGCSMLVGCSPTQTGHTESSIGTANFLP